MNIHRFLGTMVALLFLFPACAPAISKGMKDQVDKNLRFREVFSNPDAFTGRVVMWGGVIIEAKNQKEGTLLEVLQKPLDWVGQPQEGDESEGRFLALHEGFLDTALYAKGREITAAGEIRGKRVQPIGEVEYNYPLLSAREIHLWPERVKERVVPAPYWGYPWWWDYPYPHRYPRR